MASINFVQTEDAYEYVQDGLCIATITKQKILNREYWVIRPQGKARFRTVETKSHQSLRGAFLMCLDEWSDIV